MKIEKIYIKDIGPFGEEIIDLRDEWNDEISSRVLISGPNGSGKTTLLNCIAYLWKALGYWLYEKKELPKTNAVKKYFGKTGCCALLVDEVPDFTGKKNENHKKILIMIADKPFFYNTIEENDGIDYYIGERRQNDGKENYKLLYKSTLILDSEIEPQDPYVVVDIDPDLLCGDDDEQVIDKQKKRGPEPKDNFFRDWAEEHSKLIVSGSKTKSPNMIYLDAEERRWVKANKKVGRPVQEDMSKRWLYKYEASKYWESQLEASLITLKTTFPQKFHDTVGLLNAYLTNKEILTQIYPGENRLRIKIKNKRGVWHFFDELSAGEREVLVLLYSVARWMEEGGIVLVDEPDLFLYPALMPDAFAGLEELVKKRKGQLVVTSHFPDMWKRYENRAKRIKLVVGAMDDEE